MLKASETNIPVTASTLMIDMWSNGGSWSGKMPIWGEANLEIEWIELAFNASTLEAQNAPKKGIVCMIDQGEGGGNTDGVDQGDDDSGFTGGGGTAAGDDESAAIKPQARLGSWLLASIVTVMVTFAS